MKEKIILTKTDQQLEEAFQKHQEMQKKQDEQKATQTQLRALQNKNEKQHKEVAKIRNERDNFWKKYGNNRKTN